jgi:hypothetical protein
MRKIYEEILGMIDILTDEQAELKLRDDPPFTSTWYARGAENFMTVCNAAERISEMIRGRIESLSLYHE